MILEKTQAEQKHADLVADHINGLEAIKEAVIKVENYEAAEVLAKSISFIKSAYVANHGMAKEIKSIKNNLRMHLACTAMNGMLADGETSYDTIPRKAFELANEMMAAAKL